MKAVALHAAARRDRAGSGTSSATAGWPRWKPVSKQATCGTSGMRSKTRLDRRRGCAADGAGPAGQRLQLGQDLRRDDRRRREARRRRGRPGGRRRRCAHRRSGERSQAASASSAARPSRTDASSVSSTSFSPAASLTDNRGDVPMPSIWPRASSCQASASGRWNTQNFRLDEPAFRTSSVVVHGALLSARWPAAGAHGPPARATAQLAIRDRTLSARLVRMIGTRAPSTRPALSAFARKLSCLARMLPASRSGASRMSGSPATSDSMPLRLRRLLADRVVEGQRAVEERRP